MGVKQIFGVMLFAAVVAGGCTKQVNQCGGDSDCKDVTYPFCDVNGEYAASGGEHGICTIVPPNCPIERCGCSPGATTCADNTLTTCNADGLSTTTAACAIGCSDTQAHCLSFTPLFGVGVAFDGAANEADQVVANGAVVDTDAGTVKTAGGIALPIASMLVLPPGGSQLRVFYAHSFELHDLVVRGTMSASFVAVGPIVVAGKVDASANGASSGPGAITDPNAECSGKFDRVGGGGGNATAGAPGVKSAGDISVPPASGAPGSMEPAIGMMGLVGGCMGGGAASAGGGGGAIDLVSLVSVTVSGSINVGGGGGQGGTAHGGGSGGNVVIEAPAVNVAGGIVANGGGAAACSTPGGDGDVSSSPALGGGPCADGTLPPNITVHTVGGSGGTGDLAPTAGIGGNTLPAAGGGAAGRLLVRMMGTFVPQTTALISAATSTDVLTIQ